MMMRVISDRSGNSTIELAIIIVLILVNGFLALAELAIVSSRRARL